MWFAVGNAQRFLVVAEPAENIYLMKAECVNLFMLNMKWLSESFDLSKHEKPKSAYRRCTS